MFEVGRSYKVVTREGDETSYITHDVLEVDMPLVKFGTPGNYIIMNTTSPNFVSATPNDKRSKDEEGKAHEEFMKSFEVRLTDKPNT